MVFRDSVKRDAVYFFNENYERLLDGALDNITVTEEAIQLINIFAISYCAQRKLPTTTITEIERYFKSWSHDIIERGYGSVW